MGMSVGLGGPLGEGDSFWPGAGEVVKPASPCQAKEVIGW